MSSLRPLSRRILSSSLQPHHPLRQLSIRKMSSAPPEQEPQAKEKSEKASLSHLERTKEEPRDNLLHRVTLSRVKDVNENVRLFQLKPVEEEGKENIKFRAGQWLDVYVPGVPKAGGFTITSNPYLLYAKPPSYLELAVQNSPTNPPAAWLFRPKKEILNQELRVRVGGSFFWPPNCLKDQDGDVKLKRAVFIAGGVGINPLMSMVSSLERWKKRHGKVGFAVKFLYTTKDPGPGKGHEILFLNRLRKAFKTLGDEGDLKVYLTSSPFEEVKVESLVKLKDVTMPVMRRRINEDDLLEALGPVEERQDTVVYICGVPTMTDEFVEKAQLAEGIDKRNVLFEKWW